MIQPELFARLRSLAEAYRLPVAAAERVTAVTPGASAEQVLAKVEAQLADGLFRVLAAGRRFDMALPPSTRPGDQLRLSAADLRAAGLARLPGAGPAPDAESAHGEISATGRLVAHLAEQIAGKQAPGTIIASLALLPDAPIDTVVAAATLRELVALSGLFYESHQAEWVSGARDTAQLLREPQSRLPPPPSQEGAPPGSAPAAGAPPLTSAPGTAQPSPIHPDAAPLVQQQLNALEARHIVWNGQIWPGQPMRWEIEDAADERASAEAPEHSWRTRVDLQLPRLGALSALVSLGHGGLSVRLTAESAATQALLDERSEELRASLAAAGLPAVSVARQAHAAG
jgi:hypothetical protein